MILGLEAELVGKREREELEQEMDCPKEGSMPSRSRRRGRRRRS